jgi:hypothetical protein
MAWVLPAIGLGTQIVGALSKRNTKGVDYRSILDRYRSERPTGYWDPEDQLFSERAVGRANQTLGASTQEAKLQAIRRYAARGIAGPARERTLGKISLGHQLGAQRNAEAGANLKYQIRGGRERWQQGMASQAMGLELNSSYANQARRDAQNAAFWNGLGAGAGDLADFFLAGRGGGGGGDDAMMSNFIGQNLFAF